MNAQLAAQLAIPLAAIRDCWITGGSAAALTPEAWRPLIAGVSAAEGERRLAALAGQAWEVAFRPALPKDAARQKDLPRLALPTLPDRLRPLFRHALRQAPGNDRYAVLRLAERRGFSAHPLDWMPAASSEDVPDLYAPWQDWAQSLDQEDKDKGGGGDELNEDTWDSFYPAQRRLLLKAMRRQEPARALVLIAARAGQEAAEKRLALIETLAIGLGDGDAPYLQSLASDRSGKIKALAARLLARLRQASAGTGLSPEDLAELAGFFERGGKGFFKRNAAVSAKPLKSQAQAARRAELCDQSSLMELAAALGLTEAEFIDGWQFGGQDMSMLTPAADDCVARMAAQSSADEFVARLANRLMANRLVAEKELNPSLPVLLPRLDRAAQQRVMKKILAGQNIQNIQYLSRIEHGDLAQAGDILSSRIYGALKSDIKGQMREDKTPLALALVNLFAGVATAEAARAVIDDLAASFGIFPANPALAFLRLNYELANAAV
ncbi:MAG: DUF5691 domain-containing protein [Candidatus Accumulibacter sp.]|jgi:hypothetical protein|nr:DUF5691 domain-containing protein [Accumulibacter sp.]